MQLAAHELEAHLKRGLKSLYVIHGDEALLLQEAADALRAAARAQGYSERSVHSVAGAHFDWGAVLAAGAAQSLFAERQLLELRLPSGKPGKEGAAALQQLALQARDQDHTLVLILLPRLDKQTRSAAWFGTLEQHGVSVQVDAVERRALPQWIAQRLAAQGQRVVEGEPGQRALHYFAERVEGNLLAAHQEIQKLRLLYPAGELGYEQIESAVLHVARYDVFKLSEAVLGGQTARVARMLQGLKAEGESEVLAHYTLAQDILALKRVKAALGQGRPLPLALREQRVWGPREKLFERVLPKLSEEQLANLLQDAHRVDGIVKGLKLPGWPNDAWQAVQQLALGLCALCAARPTSRPTHLCHPTQAVSAHGRN